MSLLRGKFVDTSSIILESMKNFNLGVTEFRGIQIIGILISKITPSPQHQELCTKLGDKAKCCRTNLAKMLPYALDRMSSSGTEAFQQPVTTDVAPNYFDFVHYPMDMQTLRDVSWINWSN